MDVSIHASIHLDAEALQSARAHALPQTGHGVVKIGDLDLFVPTPEAAESVAIAMRSAGLIINHDKQETSR